LRTWFNLPSWRTEGIIFFIDLDKRILDKEAIVVKPPFQLVSYIAPGAPATRRPAQGNEAYLRPEIGFTPRWYRQALGIDFGARWHEEPGYRMEGVAAMRTELEHRFPGMGIGMGHGSKDLLTGTYGACTIAGILGLPILYAPDQWPTCAGPYLDEDAVENLEPPGLDTNPFFQRLMDQFDWIAAKDGKVEGFINWQGVLNNAHRLRGEALFTDMALNPGRCLRLFECVCGTMIEAAQRLHARQRESGVEVRFFTVSNCLVNLVSPQLYRELLLPFDQKIARAFGCIGIHNCAWNASPYLDAYAEIPCVAYIDMGLDSNLERARALFPHARRALMYTPTDLHNKTCGKIRRDLEHIAECYGPCDIVAADIEAETPDERVIFLVEQCREISGERGEK